MYLGLVLATGALTAPWVYAGAQAIAVHWPAAAWLAAHPFRRYVSRCLLIAGLAGLPLLGRRLRLGRTAGLGWSHPATGRAHGLAGLGLGAAGMLALVALSLAMGWRRLEPAGFGRVVTAVLAAMASGAAVAALEETLFRGVLYGSLRQERGPWLSGTFTTVLYVTSHYFARTPQAGEVGWTSGFEVLGRSVAGMLSTAALPEAVLLAAVGAVLVWARERSGGLWWPAGLHAGWVLGRKLADGLTELNGRAGWLVEWRWSLPMLALTAAALVWLIPRQQREQIDADASAGVG